MPHIFISYAKKDTRDLAFALDDALNALDRVTSWVDRSIKAGASWELQIQSEIDKCQFMVVLYSPDINRHKNGEKPSYMLKEIAYAQHTVGIPIIPVMVQQTTPPMALTTELYIDYVGEGMTLEMLVGALCDEMNIPHKPRTATPPTPVRTTFSSSTPEIPPPQKIITPPKPKIILPAPFDWCYIPQGKVTLTHIRGYLKEPTTFAVDHFWMSKYPITNAHYGEFIKEGGEKPKYWDDKDFNGATQPVVGVSWHHAMEFCTWLGKKSGLTITLPTEQEWQRAAQGDDEREYPWGNTFDTNRCNTKESGIGKTMPVTHYEGKGDSPFGVVDMSGNVWHWCLTDYDSGNNDGKAGRWNVLRGGSWDYTSGFAHVLYRGNNLPNLMNYGYGFLVVCRP